MDMGALGASSAIEIPVVPKVAKQAIDKIGAQFAAGFSNAKIDWRKMAYGAGHGIGSAMRSAGNALGKVPGAGIAAKAAGAVAGVGSQMGKAAGAVGGAVGMVGGGAGLAAGAAMSGIGMVLDMLAGFVEKVNPALVNQLNLIFDDISATIGAMLIPVLEALLPLVRMWGDFIASILPSQEEMTAVMRELQPMFDEMQIMFKEMAPVVKLLVTEFVKLAVELAKILAMLGKEFAKMNADVFRNMRRDFGAGPAGFSRSSAGASYRGPAQTSSIGELGKSLQMAAFGRALSPAERAAVATAHNTEAMKELLQKNNGDMQQALDDLTAQWSGVAVGFAKF